MKLTLRSLVAAIALTVTTAFVVRSGGAPAGRTGAPGDLTCWNTCHNSFTLNSGSKTFSITAPSTYQAGVPVAITVSFPGQAAASYGFELSVHDGSTFYALDDPTVVDPAGNTEYADGNSNYVTHTGTGLTSWSVRWTPSASSPPNAVTIYAAGVEGNGGNGNSNDYVYTTTKDMTLQVLPVELAGLAAFVDGTSVELQWWTASESNNSGFEIQRLRTGWDERFHTVAFVDGYGTTASRTDYSYRAEGLGPGKYFFRLRQIDFDGTATVSQQIEASVDVPGSFYLSPAYPNPFNPSTALELTVDRTQNIRVFVVDVRGRQVATLYEGESTSKQPLRLDFEASGLPSGAYIVKVQGELFSTSRTVTLLK